MLILTVVGVSLGAVLGLKFKVLVLVPAIVIAVLATVAQGMVHGDGIWQVGLATIVATVSLQVGYAVGLFVREAVWPRASRVRPAWMQTDQTLRPSGH